MKEPKKTISSTHRLDDKIRYLHDVAGWSFPKIGKRYGMTADYAGARAGRARYRESDRQNVEMWEPGMAAITPREFFHATNIGAAIGDGLEKYRADWSIDGWTSSPHRWID